MMVQTIAAQAVSLSFLKERFGLVLNQGESFFQEWQQSLPDLADAEKHVLDEVKQDFLYLAQEPMLEPVVKMVVVSPILRSAGFYRPPFHLVAEHEVSLCSDDQGTTIRGKIDILVCQPPFWIVVVEAKRADYSLNVGIPQALSYMLAQPDLSQPAFGFVTNGSEFIFIKLLGSSANPGQPQYELSNVFSLFNRGNDLYQVVSILKQLTQSIASSIVIN